MMQALSALAVAFVVLVTLVLLCAVIATALSMPKGKKGGGCPTIGCAFILFSLAFYVFMKVIS